MPASIDPPPQRTRSHRVELSEAMPLPKAQPSSAIEHACPIRPCLTHAARMLLERMSSRAMHAKRLHPIALQPIDP